MRKFGAIFQRELLSYFYSPTAYVSGVIFLIASGWTFIWVADKGTGPGDPLSVMMIVAIMLWLPILATVITMGAFAEEKRSGTLEAMMTAPVTEREVVLGKYFAALFFYILVIAPTASYPFILRSFMPETMTIDFGSIAAAYSIVVLVAAYCISIGVFISLLTKHQVVSAICCFCAISLPFLFRIFSRAVPLYLRDVLEYAAVEDHVMSFARGAIDSRPIVLYVSGTVLFLFFAIRTLESRRWL